MRMFLVALGVFALSATPSVAQTAPVQPEQEPAVKMVKKTVCKRIESDGETGSRLGSTSKVCREVEVPADSKGKSSAAQNESANTL